MSFLRSAAPPPPNQEAARISWRRLLLAAAPTSAAVAVMFALMADGVLAASFAVSGDSFKISADRLEGKDFQQFPGADGDVKGRRHPVAVSAIGSAEIRNMCQSVQVGLPLGKVTMRITAGRGERPVTARALVVDPEQQAGDTVFTDFQAGRDASTLTEVPGKAGPAGVFGQQADTVRITGLRQVAWATTAGTFRLPGLRLRFGGSGLECF
ncbi:DUF6230 family protein [Spirillospora sp. NPDC127200]